MIVVVVDVLVTEAGSGTAGAGIPPVVVVVSDVKVTKVDGPELIVVTNQGALPMVVKVVPRDSDPIRGSDNVQLSIVVVRANLNREF